MIFFVGKSACVKSTPLNLISGQEAVTKEKITISHEKLTTQKELNYYRNYHIGFS